MENPLDEGLEIIYRYKRDGVTIGRCSCIFTDEFIRDSAINPTEYIKQKQTEMLEKMMEKVNAE